MFLAVFLLFIPSTINTAFAEGEDQPERESQKYDESRYDLMTYADDKWYEWAQKTGTKAVSGIKNFLWNINIIVAQITLMIIYQLFSLDIIELTKDSIMEIASGTAGSLIANLGMFALAIASLGVVIRAYINQNWQAFFKIVSLLVISMALLFSIQSKNFNYVDLAHNISVSIENAVMKVNPSLTDSTDFEVSEGNIGNQVSVEVENKAYQSLLYKPYLLLQYGTTNEDTINEEGSLNGEDTRINEYLNANPMTEDGSESRQDIAKREYEDLQNENIFAGNAFTTSAYIMGVILSTVIQAIVFFFLALMRIMLQFAFVFLLILFPFMLFISLFPSFENLISQYIKGIFLVIKFKAMAVFFVLVATSFITISYEMADMSNDIYYRIFIQSIFSIAIIFMYMKRQFVMDMLQGSGLSFSSMGAGEGMGRQSLSRFNRGKEGTKNIAKKGIGGAKKGINGAKKGGKVAAKTIGTANAARNKASNMYDQAGRYAATKADSARSKVGEKMNKARDYVSQVQQGEIPNHDNPYHNEAVATNEAKTESGAAAVAGTSSINKNGSNKNVNSENVAVSQQKGQSMRNPRVAKNNPKTSYKKPNSTTNNQSSNTKHSNDKPTNTGKQKTEDSKPITQWEAQQQLSQNNERQKSARNPYHHLNEQNRQQINKSANNNNADHRKPNLKSVRSSREGLLNQRSLLHDKGNK